MREIVKEMVLTKNRINTAHETLSRLMGLKNSLMDGFKNGAYDREFYMELVSQVQSMDSSIRSFTLVQEVKYQRLGGKFRYSSNDIYTPRYDQKAWKVYRIPSAELTAAADPNGICIHKKILEETCSEKQYTKNALQLQEDPENCIQKKKTNVQG